LDRRPFQGGIKKGEYAREGTRALEGMGATGTTERHFARGKREPKSATPSREGRKGGKKRRGAESGVGAEVKVTLR